MKSSTFLKLKTNVRTIHKMGSVYVMSVTGLAGTIWFSMPPDQQVTLLEHTPIPLWTAPILATLIGVVARIWPQSNITVHEALAKSDTVTSTAVAEVLPKETEQ